MKNDEFAKKHWYKGLSDDVRSMVDEAVRIASMVDELNLGEDQDHSFMVFPAAKAYEGFLKGYFYQMGMIGRAAVMDDHFRIGKALNPDILKRQRNNDWLYDDVSDECGREVADYLWLAWREGRNRVFHYRQEEDNMLTYEKAIEKIEMIFEAMDKAESCGVRQKDDE